MQPVIATWKSGKIILDQAVDWPDGCQLCVEPVSAPTEKIGIDEADWADDAKSVADWDAWIRTVEPLEYTAEEEATMARFNEQMRRFNMDAVRRQMEVAPE